jgi:hypothetical protein
MFRLHGEDFYCRDWIRLAITEQASIFSIGFVWTLEYSWIRYVKTGTIVFFQPILRATRKSDLVQGQVRPSAEAPSALLADLGSHFKSRSRLGLMFDMAVHAGK